MDAAKYNSREPVGWQQTPRWASPEEQSLLPKVLYVSWLSIRASRAHSQPSRTSTSTRSWSRRDCTDIAGPSELAIKSTIYLSAANHSTSYPKIVGWLQGSTVCNWANTAASYIPTSEIRSAHVYVYVHIHNFFCAIFFICTLHRKKWNPLETAHLALRHSCQRWPENRCWDELKKFGVLFDTKSRVATKRGSKISRKKGKHRKNTSFLPPEGQQQPKSKRNEETEEWQQRVEQRYT